MSIALRYYTRSGNTTKLANAIAEQMGLEAKTIETPIDEKVDVLVLGCSYYAFDMDENVKKFLNDNKGKFDKIALFGTSAMMKSMKKPMKKILDAGITIMEEEFHCHGSFGPMHKGKPDASDIAAAKAFAADLCKKLG